jgi:hypothetical protein
MTKRVLHTQRWAKSFCICHMYVTVKVKLQYSTCGYYTCWNLHPQASDRENVCHLQRFTYETFQLPAPVYRNFSVILYSYERFCTIDFSFIGRMIKDMPVAFLRIEVWSYLNLCRAYALTIPRSTQTNYELRALFCMNFYCFTLATTGDCASSSASCWPSPLPVITTD